MWVQTLVHPKPPTHLGTETCLRINLPKNNDHQEYRMNINRTTLLAGVATLVLTVGAGFASAQEQQNGHSAVPQAAQPHAQLHASQPTTGGGNDMQPQRGTRAVPA